MTKKPRPSFTRQNPTKRRGEALLNNLYDTLLSCESLRETGRDFMHGTVDAWDDNMTFGVGQRLAGNGSKPTSKAYYIGKTSADIAGMVLGGVGTFGGLGMMGGGVALDATGAGAIVGVPVTAEGIAVAGHGFIMAGHSLDSLTKDLPALFKQQPGASKGGVDDLNLKINIGQQNKHIPGTNNYKQELANGKLKSILSADPQQLLDDFAGTGQKIGTNKERVDFGNVIGKYVNPETGEAVDTTVGIIHYGKNGAHIVPARPK